MKRDDLKCIIGLSMIILLIIEIISLIISKNYELTVVLSSIIVLLNTIQHRIKGEDEVSENS